MQLLIPDPSEEIRQEGNLRFDRLPYRGDLLKLILK